jgi:hypothetical protein
MTLHTILDIVAASAKPGFVWGRIGPRPDQVESLSLAVMPALGAGIRVFVAAWFKCKTWIAGQARP